MDLAGAGNRVLIMHVEQLRLGKQSQRAHIP